ncbi:hypothetical protein [Azospirillum lipoferum]|uniref:hypothetical protein n=1 Tax=Azospirillum lipoferum TaxID=193 RepID=UPI003D252A5A
MHVFVSAPGSRKPTTQIDIKVDAPMDDDFVFDFRPVEERPPPVLAGASSFKTPASDRGTAGMGFA